MFPLFECQISRCACARRTAVRDRSAQAGRTSRTVADGAVMRVGLCGPGLARRWRVQVSDRRQDHGRGMVVVRRVVMVVIRRVPMRAMVGVPSGMIGLHRKLAWAMGQGPEKRCQDKRAKQHACCHPSHDRPDLAHLPFSRPVPRPDPSRSVLKGRCAGLRQPRSAAQALLPSGGGAAKADGLACQPAE